MNNGWRICNGKRKRSSSRELYQARGMSEEQVEFLLEYEERMEDGKRYEKTGDPRVFLGRI